MDRRVIHDGTLCVKKILVTSRVGVGWNRFES